MAQKYYTKIIPNINSDGLKTISEAYADNKKVSNGIKQIQDQGKCLNMSLLQSGDYHISLDKLETNNIVCDNIKPRDIQDHINGSKWGKNVQECVDYIKKLACNLFDEFKATKFEVVDKEEIVDETDRVATMGKYLAVKLTSDTGSEHMPNNPHISVVRGASYGAYKEAEECLNELLEQYIRKANDRNLVGSVFVSAIEVEITDSTHLKYTESKCAGETSAHSEL